MDEQYWAMVRGVGVGEALTLLPDTPLTMWDGPIGRRPVDHNDFGIADALLEWIAAQGMHPWQIQLRCPFYRQKAWSPYEVWEHHPVGMVAGLAIAFRLGGFSSHVGGYQLLDIFPWSAAYNFQASQTDEIHKWVLDFDHKVHVLSLYRLPDFTSVMQFRPDAEPFLATVQARPNMSFEGDYPKQITIPQHDAAIEQWFRYYDLMTAQERKVTWKKLASMSEFYTENTLRTGHSKWRKERSKG